jgi:hypothetical protein
LEAEAAGDGGAAVLEVVEVGGDTGGVEGPTELERHVGVGEGEPVEVRAEQPVVDLVGPPGQPCEVAPAERRHLGAQTELVARQSMGHPEADEAFDGPPRTTAARERRAQAEGLAELAQVDHGRFALAPQHRQAPQDQQRGRADDSGPHLFDVGVNEREPDPPHLRVGAGTAWTASTSCGSMHH